MSKKNTGFSFSSVILSLLRSVNQNRMDDDGKSHAPIRTSSALALSRMSGFPPSASLHKPTTININSTARVACIRTVSRDILIAFALGI
jgi:hypothetical protein